VESLLFYWKWREPELEPGSFGKPVKFTRDESPKSPERVKDFTKSLLDLLKYLKNNLNGYHISDSLFLPQKSNSSGG
jgi:hypothetical protein